MGLYIVYEIGRKRSDGGQNIEKHIKLFILGSFFNFQIIISYIRQMIKSFLAIFLAFCFSVNTVHLRQRSEANNNGANINNKSMTHYNNLSEASQRLYDILMDPTAKGVKVAALLLDQNGRLVKEGRNQVVGPIGTITKNTLKNPIRHAEQQLMFWYWENREALSLPPPQKLTILTSLDPCLMCGSTILLSGFNVGVISFDRFGGVNFKLNGFENYNFAPKIKEKLLQKFGYYKVNGEQSRKQYRYQANHTVFKDDTIQKELEEKITLQFLAQQQSLKLQEFDDNLPKNFKNLLQLPQQSSLIQSLKNLYSHTLSITLTVKAYKDGKESSTFQPTLQLKDYLTALLKDSPHAKNALALIDPYGNLLLARTDRFDISPIHTAMVNVVQDYSNFYVGLLQAASKQGDFRETDTYAYLPALPSCSLIFLNALPGDDLVSLQALTIHGYAINQARKTIGPIYINDYEPNAVTLESVIPDLPLRYGKGHFDLTPALAKVTREAK